MGWNGSACMLAFCKVCVGMCCMYVVDSTSYADYSG